MVEKNFESCFESEEEKKLSDLQRKYLCAFRATGNATKAAKIMGVSTGTCGDQIRNICNKLGFENTYELLPEDMRRSVRGKGEQATSSQMMHLLIQQEFRCALTGHAMRPSDCSLDHKTPVSKGGTDKIENLQFVTTEINKAKGVMPNDEFIQMCKRVAAWNS